MQAEEVSLADLVSKLSVTAGDLTPKDRLPSALPQQPATPDSTQEEAFAEYSQTPWTVLEDAEAERPVQAAAQAAGRSLVAVPAAVRCAACFEDTTGESAGEQPCICGLQLERPASMFSIFRWNSHAMPCRSCCSPRQHSQRLLQPEPSSMLVPVSLQS